MFYEEAYYIEFLSANYELGSIDLSLSFALTSLSFLFLFLVISIGFAATLYTLNYFKNEADEGLFLFWLNAFIASMSLLILSNNYFTFFLGWELIGLTSFFLINFWTAKRSTLKASFKAFSFNLLSDLCLLIGFVNLYLYAGTADISLVTLLIELSAYTTSYYLNIAAISLFICASIKSVQIGGHLWLPDSMEAPVPASALIHSATLVSAGVYLLLKFFNLFLIVNFLPIILYIGALTAGYGGVVAASQTDLKKLLAYSTMSHCGFLFILVSFGFFIPTIIYLYLHGIFKATTFFCAGSFIRVFKSQDMRLMGIASRVLPIDTALLIICAGNLGGLPFTFGYLYKFFFIKTLLVTTHHLVSFGFIVLGLLSSILYVYKIIYYSSFDYLKGNFNQVITWLQGATFNISLYSTLSTPITFYTTIFLLILAFGVYVLGYYLIMGVLIDLLTISDWYSSFILLIRYYSLLYLPYILVFYFFYILIIIYLFIVEGRFKFLKHKAFYSYIFILLGLFTLVISL